MITGLRTRKHAREVFSQIVREYGHKGVSASCHLAPSIISRAASTGRTLGLRRSRTGSTKPFAGGLASDTRHRQPHNFEAQITRWRNADTPLATNPAFVEELAEAAAASEPGESIRRLSKKWGYPEDESFRALIPASWLAQQTND